MTQNLFLEFPIEIIIVTLFFFGVIMVLDKIYTPGEKE